MLLDVTSLTAEGKQSLSSANLPTSFSYLSKTSDTSIPHILLSLRLSLFPSIFPKASLLFQWPKYFHFFIKISNHWSSTLMYCYNVSSRYLYCFSYTVHIGMVTTFGQKGCLFDPLCSHLQDKTKQSYLNCCLGAIINFFKNVQMRISV